MSRMSASPHSDGEAESTAAADGAERVTLHIAGEKVEQPAHNGRSTNIRALIAERSIGATAVSKADRLRLILLVGVGGLVVMLVLVKLKGGGVPATATSPIDQTTTASGTIFAEDLAHQLSKSPGVTRVVGSYVPGNRSEERRVGK